MKNLVESCQIIPTLKHKYIYMYQYVHRSLSHPEVNNPYMDLVFFSLFFFFGRGGMQIGLEWWKHVKQSCLTCIISPYNKRCMIHTAHRSQYLAVNKLEQNMHPWFRKKKWKVTRENSYVIVIGPLATTNSYQHCHFTNKDSDTLHVPCPCPSSICAIVLLLLVSHRLSLIPEKHKHNNIYQICLQNTLNLFHFDFFSE